MPIDETTTGRNDLYRENRRQLEALKRQGPREVYGVLLDGVAMELWYIDRYGSDGWRSILSTRSFEEIVQAYIDARIKEGGTAAVGGPARPRETLLYEDNRKSLDALQKQQPRQMHGILLDYNQMETWYVARYGMDGWHQILSTKPLEQIIQDYINEQLKAQKARNARQAGNGRPQTAAADSPEAAVPILPDDDDDILYVPLSTLTEQELLDERRRQDTTRDRRQEIDDTLEAIQAAREQALEEGLYFGEETAEDIARHMRGSRSRSGNDSADGPVPVPVVIPEWGGEPGIPGGSAPSPDAPPHLHHGGGAYGDYGAAGLGGDHSMDFDPFYVMEGLNDGGRDTGDGQQGRDTGDGQRGRDTGSGQQGTSSGSPARSDGEDDGEIAPVPPMYGPEGAAEGELPPPPESSAGDGGESDDDGDAPSEVPHVSGNGLDQGAAPGDGGGGADGATADSGGDGESVRNSLNDGKDGLGGGPGSLLEDNPVADAAKQAARKKMRILVLHALSAAAPFIIGLLFVVMIVACINDKLGGSGGGSTSGTSTTAAMNSAAPTMDTGASGGSSGDGSGGSSAASGTGGGGVTVVRRRSRNTNGLPNVDIDYAGLHAMFDTEGDGGVQAGRTAPPVDMPAFDDWFDNDDEYIEMINKKAKKYDSDTQWMEMIDTDLCRYTLLVKAGGKWTACGGYATVCGKTATKNPDGSIETAWGYWDGPRACTPHGAFKILAGRMKSANNTMWNVCHYPAAHMGGDGHDCWCHRTHENYGIDPATLPLSERHQSHGCTRFRNEVAQWIYENIKENTTRVVFDQVNPEPEECDMNDPSNEGKADMERGDWSTWKGYDSLMSSSYDRKSPCGRSQDPQSGKAGHVSGGKSGSAKATPDAAGGESISDGTLTANQRAVVAACSTTASPGSGFCAGWVTNVYVNAGLEFFGGNADEMYYAYCTSTNKSDLKPGMLVAVSTHSHTAAGSIYGHIGIYTGNGMMMDNVGYVRTISVDEWIDYYSTTVPVKWGFGPGLP